MIAAVDRFAAGASWSTAVDGVPVRDADLRAALSGRGYLRTTGRAYAELELGHDSWEAFLEDARTRNRKAAGMIRNEESRARREGLVFREWDPAKDDALELHELLDVHARRLNGRPFPFGPEFLPTLSRALGRNLHVLLAARDGQTQGLAVVMTHGTRGYALYPGLIERAERSGLVYFNVTYYQAIRLAIDRGLERMAYGNGVYQAKIRRGCSITMTEIHFRPRSGFVRALLRTPTGFHHRFMERKFAPLSDAAPFSFPEAR
jgi:predicted N-acyltransferase